MHAEDGAGPADVLPFQTSRLCVKNIPKYVNEARLRQFFSEQGDVTDVKIVKTKDGQSRCFGFIGLKTLQQAIAVQKYFHKSFMDTSRLEIDFAESFKTRDKEAHRPWSKHSEGSSAHLKQTAVVEEPVEEKSTRKSRKAEKEEAASKDAKLAEFLDLMKPRSTAKSFANDELLPDNAATAAQLLALDQQHSARAPLKASKKGSKNKRSSSPASDSDDDDDYQDLSSAARRGGDEDGAGDEDDMHGAVGGGGDEDGTVMDDDISDLAYLKSRMRAALPADDEDNDEDAGGMRAARTVAKGRGAKAGGESAAAVGSESADSSDDEDSDDEAAEGEGGAGARSVPAESSGREHDTFTEDPATLIMQTGRLFVRNLAYSATDDELHEAFCVHGSVTDAHVARDRESQKSKGFALVQYAKAQDALSAYEAMDGCIFQGRLIHVLPGKRAMARDTGDEDGDEAVAKGFKEQRAAARKADAGDRSAWSTLYMRQDTVVEAVAALLGVDKSEFLDPEASDVAVRLALGETQVIAATKASLEEGGVNAQALEAAAAASGHASAHAHVQRSATVLILKNLPYSSTQDELSTMFDKFGGAVRVVLPNTRTMAVVELADKESARAAFKGLAYTRYHHVPLYLEWAPSDIFAVPEVPDSAQQPSSRSNAATAAASAAAAGVKAGDKSRVKSGDKAGGEGTGLEAEGGGYRASSVLTGLVDAEAGDDEDGSSVYVKNISFTTTEDALKKYIDKAASAASGVLRSARISTQKRADGKTVSKGFGFVEFGDRSTARAVMARLQGKSLDGHKLELQMTTRKADKKSGSVKAKEGNLSETKVLVKNLAFEATAKEVRALLEAFGHVKTCRLPQKFDGSKRGFAFAEFGTKGEAKKAIDAVHGAHLYGRRLLLEYAKEDEGLDELRAKTKAHMDGGRPSTKRRKTEGLGIAED